MNKIKLLVVTLSLAFATNVFAKPSESMNQNNPRVFVIQMEVNKKVDKEKKDNNPSGMLVNSNADMNNGNSKGKPFITSQVPEAETYSMMLMGLGLMGFIACRRRNNQA